jgi:hypothetical protein
MKNLETLVRPPNPVDWSLRRAAYIFVGVVALLCVALVLAG